MAGMSLIEFVNDYKIYKAVQAFKEGQTNVVKVAEMCGFGDIKNFRQLFKRKMNMTPKQYVQSLCGRWELKVESWELWYVNSQLIITLNSQSSTLNYLILRVVFVFIRFFTIYEKSPFFELKTPHSYYPFIVILRQKQSS